jgi:deazaflavin-dependent oxidoreductase (nitroreductase family)
MSVLQRSDRAPRFVGFFNALVRRLLAFGLPLGPNALLTVRGRKSGRPRTTPVAVIEIDGGRWISSPYGDVNWVRNLRAEGQGVITVRGRTEEVRAVELSTEEAAVFFAETFGPYVRGLPAGRFILSLLGAREMVDDPQSAARRHPVFELHAAVPLRP